MEKRSSAAPNGKISSYLISAAIGDLVVPTLAVFLPLLTLAVGGNFLEVGIVGGISYAMNSFLPYLMGKYSDRSRSIHILLAGSFAILTCTSLVYVFASNPIEIIAARAVEGIGWSMLWPTLQSGVTIASGDKNRNLSVYNSVWSAAYAVGPIVAGVFATIGSLRVVFISTSILLAVGLLVNLRFHQANSGQKKVTSGSSVISNTDSSKIETEEKSIEKKSKGKSLYVSAIIVSAFTIAIILTFFPPIGKLNGISVLIISVITSGYGISRFLAYFMTTNDSYRSRLFSHRNTDNLVVLLVLVVAGASASLFVFDNDPILSFLAFAAIGVTYSIVSAIAQSKIIAEAEPLRTGEAAGIFEISIGIGTFLGPTIAGVLFQFGKISPFLTPSLGIAVFIFYFLAKFINAHR